MTKELSARLAAAAREKDVHIYLLTVPRHKTEEVETLGEKLSKTWLKDLLGAVIIFDDDTGKMTVTASDRVEKEFTSLQLNLLLRSTLLTTTRADQLSRDKLFAIANLLASGLVELKASADRETHRGHVSNLIMAVIAIVGIGLALFSALAKPKTAATSASEPAPKVNPPADF